METSNLTTKEVEIYIMRLPEVMRLSGLSRSTIYKYVEEGLWPRPVQIGKRAVGWPSGEIEKVNRARIEGISNMDIIKLVQSITAERKM